MPAFDAADPDALSFRALVEPWLRARPHLRDFDQLHFALDGLHYMINSDRTGINPPSAKSTTHVKCSMHDCTVTSATRDACLVNYAPAGTTPLWFCRNHHPRVEGLPPPGWHPSAPAIAERRALIASVWTKLTPVERTALNRNIVTLAESSHD